MHRRFAVVCLIAFSLMLIATLAIPGCSARDTRLRIESSAKMRIWGMAILQYQQREGQDAFPQNFEALRPFIEEGFDDLLKNPLTGDNPGYELVAPTPDRPVVMYQLRNGKRDESLEVLWADGGVRPLR